MRHYSRPRLRKNVPARIYSLVGGSGCGPIGSALPAVRRAARPSGQTDCGRTCGASKRNIGTKIRKIKKKYRNNAFILKTHSHPLDFSAKSRGSDPADKATNPLIPLSLGGGARGGVVWRRADVRSRHRARVRIPLPLTPSPKGRGDSWLCWLDRTHVRSQRNLQGVWDSVCAFSPGNPYCESRKTAAAPGPGYPACFACQRRTVLTTALM